MHLWDYVILAAILLAVAVAVVSVLLRRKKGCGCSCEGCSAACPLAGGADPDAKDGEASAQKKPPRGE